MIEAISVGLVCAVIVGLDRLLPPLPFNKLFIALLLVATLAFMASVQTLITKKKNEQQYTSNYFGLPDLFLHIHAAVSSESYLKWAFYGFSSFMMRVCGGFVGIEGAAIEISQAFMLRWRARASRWFEGKRRTDAATAIAGSISAAFGAPFTGMVFPIELNTGGNSLLMSVSAISAYLFSSLFQQTLTDGSLFGFRETFENIHIVKWQWINMFYVSVISVVGGFGILGILKLFHSGFSDLFKSKTTLRILFGSAILGGLIWMGGNENLELTSMLHSQVTSRSTLGEVSYSFCAIVFAMMIVSTTIGSCGIFLPVLILGNFFGFGVAKFLLGESFEFSLVSGFVSAAGIWSVIFNAPLSAALVGFEITKNIDVLFGGLFASYLARWLCQMLKVSNFLNMGLKQKGATIIEGRSMSVLDTIFVREAMVTDYEIVHEHEPVSEIYMKLKKCRYPFFPVTTTQGHYVGLISIDMVEEAKESQEMSSSSNSSLTKLLEAKDLLYRSGIKSPTVSPGDRLSISNGLFQHYPCVPVLDEEGRVSGLLFVHTVRLAYDREIARRSIRG